MKKKILLKVWFVDEFGKQHEATLDETTGLYADEDGRIYEIEYDEVDGLVVSALHSDVLYM